MPEEEEVKTTQEDVKQEEVSANVEAQAGDSSKQQDQGKQADAVAEENASQSEEKPEEVDYEALYKAEKTRRIEERTRLKRKLKEKETNPDAGKSAKEEVKVYKGNDADWSPEKGKPTMETSGYDAELLAERMADWKLYERDQNAASEARAQEENRKLSEFDQKAAEHAAEDPDYAKFLEEKQDEGYGDSDVHAMIMRAGPELDHFLGQPENADKLESVKRIADKGEKLIELANLAAEAKAWAAKRKGKTKTITKAPAPVNTVAGGGGTTPKDPRYDPNCSMEDYIEYSNR